MDTEFIVKSVQEIREEIINLGAKNPSEEAILDYFKFTNQDNIRMIKLLIAFYRKSFYESGLIHGELNKTDQIKKILNIEDGD